MPTPDPRTPRVEGLSSALIPPPPLPDSPSSVLRPPPSALLPGPPPSACGERSRTALRHPPFFAVHQSINAFQPNNLPGFSKLFQSPRPSQPGQTRSASRSAVTVSELDYASDAHRRAKLEGYPGKRRAISVGVHYHSPRSFHVPGREKMGLSHAHVHLDSFVRGVALGHSVDGSLAQQKPRPTTRPQRRGNPIFSPARPLAPVRSLVTGGARSTPLAPLGTAIFPG